jgi:ABC-type uncharacterized transport system permease subunit
MTPDIIFQCSSSLAMLGWLILLIASPFWLKADKFIIGIIVTLFCVVYTWLISSSFLPADMKNFSSLDGVSTLFQNKKLLTAGWVHYLAFDLLAGCWIKRNSLRYGINHWMIIPSLLLTFMLGPVGVLLYLLVRWVKTKKYFSENYN